MAGAVGLEHHEPGAGLELHVAQRGGRALGAGALGGLIVTGAAQREGVATGGLHGHRRGLVQREAEQHLGGDELRAAGTKSVHREVRRRGERQVGLQRGGRLAGLGLGGGPDLHLQPPGDRGGGPLGAEVQQVATREGGVGAEIAALASDVGLPQRLAVGVEQAQLRARPLLVEVQRHVAARGQIQRKPVLVPGAERHLVGVRGQRGGQLHGVVGAQPLGAIGHTGAGGQRLGGELVGHRGAGAPAHDHLQHAVFVGGQDAHLLDAVAQIAGGARLGGARVVDRQREITRARRVAHDHPQAFASGQVHVVLILAAVTEHEVEVGAPQQLQGHGIVVKGVALAGVGLALAVLAELAAGAVLVGFAGTGVLAQAQLAARVGPTVVVHAAHHAAVGHGITARGARGALGVVGAGAAEQAGALRADLRAGAVPVGGAGHGRRRGADLLDARAGAVVVLRAVGHEARPVGAAELQAGAVLVGFAAGGAHAVAGLGVAGLRAGAFGVDHAGRVALAGVADARRLAVGVLLAHLGLQAEAQRLVAALGAGAGAGVYAGVGAQPRGAGAIGVAVFGHEALARLGALAGHRIADAGAWAVRVFGAPIHTGAGGTHAGAFAVVVGVTGAALAAQARRQLAELVAGAVGRALAGGQAVAVLAYAPRVAVLGGDTDHRLGAQPRFAEAGAGAVAVFEAGIGALLIQAAAAVEAVYVCRAGAGLSAGAVGCAGLFAGAGHLGAAGGGGVGGQRVLGEPGVLGRRRVCDHARVTDEGGVGVHLAGVGLYADGVRADQARVTGGVGVAGLAQRALTDCRIGVVAGPSEDQH